MAVYECIWVPVGDVWSLWVSIGICGLVPWSGCFLSDMPVNMEIISDDRFKGRSSVCHVAG